MSFKTDIQTAIYNDATVQSLVSSYELGSTTYYMIAQGTLFPSSIETDTDSEYEPTVQDNTINHYVAGNIDGSEPVQQLTHIVACRAYEESTAEDIQDAVFNALNRIKSNDGCSYFTCSKLPVIPPLDNTDNYNAQVEILVKTSN